MRELPLPTELPAAASRERALHLGPSRLRFAPAALILLVWAFLWMWLALGVVAPLSRIETPPRADPVTVPALRA
jgi:hypothetical protein